MNLQEKLQKYRHYLNKKHKVKAVRKFDEVFGPPLFLVLPDELQELITMHFGQGWNYAACDQDGQWHVFEEEPSIDQAISRWMVRNGESKRFHQGVNRANWDETLLNRKYYI